MVPRCLVMAPDAYPEPKTAKTAKAGAEEQRKVARLFGLPGIGFWVGEKLPEQCPMGLVHSC